MPRLSRFQWRTIIAATSLIGGGLLVLHQCNRRGGSTSQATTIRDVTLDGGIRARIEQRPPSDSTLHFETTHITFYADQRPISSWSSDGARRFKVQINHLQFMGMSGPSQQSVRFAYIGKAAGDGHLHLGIMGWSERARFDVLESNDGSRRFAIHDAPISTNASGDLIIYIDELMTDKPSCFRATLHYTPYNKSAQIKSLSPCNP